MSEQLDIFAEPYPGSPGWKARETSRQAAEAMKPQAKTLRARVLDEIRKAPGTPEQIAHRLKEPLMNVRPRCSELAAKNMIVDSEARGQAMGGRKAIVWKVAE